MEKLIFSGSSSATITPFATIKECAKSTIEHITSGKIALSGSSTFRELCTAWSKEPISFKSPQYFPVDERVVPFDDPQSNWGMIYTTFLEPSGFKNQNAHFAESAEQYEKLLQITFKNRFPVFDVAFLGVGDDGHTASLFPSHSFLHSSDALVLSTRSPRPPVDRITLAPITIINAKKVIVVVHGENKRYILREIMNNNEDLPIVRILSARKKSEIFVNKNLL